MSRFPDLDEYIAMQERTVAMNTKALKKSKATLLRLKKQRIKLEKKYK